MHRTTISIADELHFRLRNLGWRRRTSVSLLLEAAALEALAPLLQEPPCPDALRRWETRVRDMRFARDKRFRWNRRVIRDEPRISYGDPLQSGNP